MPTEGRGERRYLAAWLTAEQARPLLALPVSRRVGLTAVVTPLDEAVREEVLALLHPPAAVARQATTATELRLTPRKGGWYVALGPLG